MNLNLLCFGDNLTFMRNWEILREESVDLICLDPPFIDPHRLNLAYVNLPDITVNQTFDRAEKFQREASTDQGILV